MKNAKYMSVEPGAKMVDPKTGKATKAEGETLGWSTMDAGTVQYVRLDDGREVLIDVKDMAEVPQ